MALGSRQEHSSRMSQDMGKGITWRKETRRQAIKIDAVMHSLRVSVEEEQDEIYFKKTGLSATNIRPRGPLIAHKTLDVKGQF